LRTGWLHWRPTRDACRRERVNTAFRALEALDDLVEEPGEVLQLIAAHGTEHTSGTAAATGTGSTRSRARRHAMTAEGIISGALLQAARRTTRLTQEDFAEAIGVSVDTVKRWENGQRPLGRVKAADLAQMQRQLRQLGARPALLARIPAAIDADEFTRRALRGDCSQLASEVTTRPWSSLVAWAATGKPPEEVEDVAPRRALLAAGERRALFTSIRAAAACSPANDDASCLMRHQAYYLAGLDTSFEGTTWLADAARTETSRLRLTGKWTPGWAVARSLAVAVACQGDAGPLRWFVDRHMDDAECDEANLSYWAYWLGSDPEPASGEEFMVKRRVDMRRAAALLHHLTANLSAALPYAELSAESARSLLRRWPDLLRYDPETARDLAERTSRMLDDRSLPATVRPALSDLHFAARRATA
jgi:DNA-binding transcriptional regulator YiaG